MKDNESQLIKNNTNDKTNINLQKSFINKRNSNLEEEKNEYNNNINENNHEEIIIKSNEYNQPYTIIEAKLPNPYLNTELVKNKKYINFNIKSKFKSKYADYANYKKGLHEIKNSQSIKYNKTYKFCKIDKYIHFTNVHINDSFQKKTRTLTRIYE
jgi:hypothetical protein